MVPCDPVLMVQTAQVPGPLGTIGLMASASKILFGKRWDTTITIIMFFSCFFHDSSTVKHPKYARIWIFKDVSCEVIEL